MKVLEIIKALWRWLSANWTAVCVILFNVEEKRVDDAKVKEQDAELKLKLEEDKTTITNKYLGKSDADIIREVTGGPEPQPGKPKKDS